MTNLSKKLPQVPLDCIWLITSACNLRCIHCESESGKKDPNELTTIEALNVADQLAEAGCLRVSLSGGEPLLRRDWSQIVGHLAKNGIETTIITNGLLLDQLVVAKMADAGAIGGAVSLDGDREVHDSIRVSGLNRTPSRYDAAIKAIENLSASQLKTAVITQVNRRNLHLLNKMYQLLVELGIDSWQVQIAMPLGRLLKLESDYLIEPADVPGLVEMLAGFARDGRMAMAVADNIGYYGKHEPFIRGALNGKPSFYGGCMAGCRLVSICSNGDVKGCPSHPAEFAAGNLREESFHDIWSDRSRFGYNTEWNEELLAGECAACPYRRICRAGCTSMAYAVTGTIYDNPFCLQRKEACKNTSLVREC